MKDTHLIHAQAVDTFARACIHQELTTEYVDTRGVDLMVNGYLAAITGATTATMVKPQDSRTLYYRGNFYPKSFNADVFVLVTPNGFFIRENQITKDDMHKVFILYASQDIEHNPDYNNFRIFHDNYCTCTQCKKILNAINY